MPKALIVDYSKCHGCQICEIACSLMGEISTGSCHPRIRSIVWELDGTGLPIICQHCQDAPCIAVCPKSAIYRDEENNRVLINYDRCIGCRICMTVCPVGAIDFDIADRKVVKCDLCDGAPLCAKLCPYEALQYLELKGSPLPNYLLFLFVIHLS